jgi:plasmid stabilization system protein ParE
MKPVVFASPAQAELDAAAAHYEAQRAGLGQVFRAEVNRVARLIERHPGIGTLVGVGNVRRRALSRFPYNLVYTEQDTVTVVIAVAHQKRQPRYWMNRLP